MHDEIHLSPPDLLWKVVPQSGGLDGKPLFFSLDVGSSRRAAYEDLRAHDVLKWSNIQYTVAWSQPFKALKVIITILKSTLNSKQAAGAKMKR